MEPQNIYSFSSDGHYTLIHHIHQCHCNWTDLFTKLFSEFCMVTNDHDLTTLIYGADVCLLYSQGAKLFTKNAVVYCCMLCIV